MLTKEIKISSFDVFPNSILKPSALMRHMQQLAREDCDAMGCTYRFMRSINTVFVMTKCALEFFRPIREGEIVSVRTFNNRIEGITFTREFEISAGGEEAAHATTSWVLVRYDTRALVRPKAFPVQFESLGMQCRTLSVPRAFDLSEMTERGSRIVRVSDLDENNHLNNCIYTDIALDALPFFDGCSSFVSDLKLIFRHEARRGDVLKLASREHENVAIVSAFDETSAASCFDAELTFKEV